VRGVFCDIDDTLTTGERVTAAAYAAMGRRLVRNLRQTRDDAR